MSRIIALLLLALARPGLSILQIDVDAGLIDETCMEQISGAMHLLGHEESYPSTATPGPDGFPLMVHLQFDYDDTIVGGLVTQVDMTVGQQTQTWTPEANTVFYGQGPMFPETGQYQVFPPCGVSVDHEAPRPSAFGLSAAPNPFNPSTSVQFDLAVPADVRLVLHRLDGSRALELLDGPRGAGRHRLDLDAGSLASGLYLLRLEADGRSECVRLLLLK